MQQRVGKGTDRPASEKALTVSWLIALARPASHVTLVKSSDGDDDATTATGANDDAGDLLRHVHVHNQLERIFILFPAVVNDSVRSAGFVRVRIYGTMNLEDVVREITYTNTDY